LGSVERPSIWKLQLSENPAKHIILREVKEPSEIELLLSVKSHLKQLGQKTLFLFIHGFNVTFAGAARRAAQVAYDLFLVGQERGQATLSVTPVLYSWPSNGEIIRYPHDANNAEVSASNLKIFLKEIAIKSGAEAIIILAHSMGNRTLTAALNEVGLSMRPGDRPIVSEIILAAPDIDKGMFLNIADAVKRTGARVTLYASSRDRALHLSRTINGFPRLGDATGGVCVCPDIDSIDASVVGDDILAHSYYGETDLLVDLHALITQRMTPDKRFGLLAEGIAGERYWRMRARAG